MATNNNEFFDALAALEKERGLPADYLIDKIKAAIVIAVKKDYEVEDDNVVVDIDPNIGAFRASLLQDIVEEVENPHTQVSLEDAQKIRKTYKVGQRLVTPLKTKEFGRIAAQTAKHVIRQGLREGERSLQCSEMQSRAHEIITGTVTAVDAERGNIVLDLGKGGSAVLPKNEQVPGEHFTEGQMVQVYVVDVLATERGPRVTISRTHPGLVKRMFELEVPEIYDGTVEIKAIAREAGARTKMAVWSKNPDVDPVGACIGAHGSRVEKIVEELGGEKIDIIRWSEDINEFISAALSPAKVVKVELLPGDCWQSRLLSHQRSAGAGSRAAGGAGLPDRYRGRFQIGNHRRGSETHPDHPFPGLQRGIFRLQDCVPPAHTGDRTDTLQAGRCAGDHHLCTASASGEPGNFIHYLCAYERGCNAGAGARHL